jgi:hypothetical protein
VPCYRECDSVVVVGKLLWFQCFGNAFEDLGFEGIERLVIGEFDDCSFTASLRFRFLHFRVG